MTLNREVSRLGWSQSTHAHESRREGGFTLLEALTVLTILLLIGLLGYPAMRNLVDRGRILGAVRDVSAAMVEARQTAVRQGVTVVARADLTDNSLVVFANVDGDADFEFDETADSGKRLADFEVARARLPVDFKINFHGPADKDPKGGDEVDGFTATKTGPAAVFEIDGSVRDPGAFRIADDRGNFFELRIEATATGRAVVHKYNPDPPGAMDPGFYEDGRNSSDLPLWEWY